MVRDLFWDDQFRPKWDDMLVNSTTLEECPTTGTMKVQWIRKVWNLFTWFDLFIWIVILCCLCNCFHVLMAVICLWYSSPSSAKTENTLSDEEYGNVGGPTTASQRYLKKVHIFFFSSWSHWLRMVKFCSVYLVFCSNNYFSSFQGVDCPSIPRQEKPRRVDVYYSSWCIRAGLFW